MNLLASTELGNITPPGGYVPTTGGDPSGFVASIIQNLIRLLLIVAFIVFLLWTIFAGIRFITAGGDEKAVGSSWSQIYWGLIGMIIVVGAYAILRIVEIFFGVNIVSGGFRLTP